jgi:uncharacterized membrane protein
MISQKQFEIFSYFAIGIVAVLLILMFIQVIPVSWYITVLVFSLVLIGLRFALRFYFIIQSKKNLKE